MKSRWEMNGELIDERDIDFDEVCNYVRRNIDEFLGIEQDEPGYFSFYDVYGNKHEYATV